MAALNPKQFTVDHSFQEALGCSVANGGAPCNHLCGGGWPGTKITHDEMSRALRQGRLIPETLRCGPLEEQARHWYRTHSVSEPEPAL